MDFTNVCLILFLDLLLFFIRILLNLEHDLLVLLLHIVNISLQLSDGSLNVILASLLIGFHFSYC